MSQKPCVGCDKDEATIYRKGKVRMRFKRAGRRVGLHNYKDGEIYWMKPRHAAYSWWEPVDNVELPIVKQMTKDKSVYEMVIGEDTPSETIISEEGYTLSGSLPPLDDEEKFGDPDGFVDRPVEIIMPTPPVRPSIPREKPLGFPESESPSQKWTRTQLLAYIRYKGAEDKLPSGYKSKAFLLSFASNLT